MFEYINAPDLSNKVLKEVKWEVKVGDFVRENDLLCVLTVEVHEDSLLAHILNQKVVRNEKVRVYSKGSGVVRRVSEKEEMAKSKRVCDIECGKNLDVGCGHEIEYGGICVKCGEFVEE